MDLLSNGPTGRYTAASDDDVPYRAPVMLPAPTTNARRRVRYGDGNSVKESKQQMLINALRGAPQRTGFIQRR